ncbi:flagellar biosynthetic protein FliO, partial [Janthinobacterium rivuli]
MKPGLLISTMLPLLAACSIARAEPATASAPAASAASASVALASEPPPA